VLSLGLTPLQFMISPSSSSSSSAGRSSDRDHRHLHADLHPAAAKFGIDPLFFRPAWWRSTCRRAYPLAAGAMAAFYLKGVAPTARHAEPIFAGKMPFMASRSRGWCWLYVSRRSGSGCRASLRPVRRWTSGLPHS